jgi:hypothetical protein
MTALRDLPHFIGIIGIPRRMMVDDYYLCRAVQLGHWEIALKLLYKNAAVNFQVRIMLLEGFADDACRIGRERPHCTGQQNNTLHQKWI